jgi:hypothetical protein
VDAATWSALGVMIARAGDGSGGAARRARMRAAARGDASSMMRGWLRGGVLA